MPCADDDTLKDFLIESHENLDRLDSEFVALESDPAARDRIAAIFRTIHTIKGASGFLGLTKLSALTHAGESLLAKLRDGTLALTPEITSGLLAMVDRVRVTLGHLADSGEEGTESDEAIIASLDALSETARAAQTPKLGEILVQSGAVAPQEVAAALDQQQTDHRRLGEILVARGSVPVKTVEDALAAQSEGRHTIADTNIRVDVALLDKLMNLVGELVLARNQILQFGVQGKDAAFASTTQRLNLITTELQEGVMKTRMQPIGNVWNKFPRVVRDLALACGKHVDLAMEGNHTELDRTIIEAIKDPLTHIVRNAIDHGIEAPEVRAARGKPATGRLSLRAFHEGGQVNIEISDDGAGVDPDVVRHKAVERGLVGAERANHLSEREILSFIFAPGFSTAEKVTNVSGRGVGMDVVKTNIEKIGGTVDVQSRVGVGTQLKIKIPLTLAIIPALIVSSHDERFAIPQVSLLELVRLEGDQAQSAVEHVHGAPVYRLRGKLLPLVYLNRVLELSDAGPPEAALNIVVVRADDRQFGLVVDAVSDTEEIVVKPLGKELKWLTAFAGATIMGDGRVALIIDVLGLAQRADVLAAQHDHPRENARDERAVDREKQALLLFRASDDSRMAIPLSMVARLEEVERARVERAGSCDVIQYRGEILPLVDVGSLLCGQPAAGDGASALQVVVSTESGRTVGLIVGRILDIVEESVVVKRRYGLRGVLGAAVVQGKVTDVLDVHELVAEAAGTFNDASAA